MKKLLVIAIFLLVQDSLAAENLDAKTSIEEYNTRCRLYVLPGEIHSLLEQRKISESYTKAAELKTRKDVAALESKCYLTVLLRTFPDEEASQFALISEIDKDMSYEQAVIEYSFRILLALHHRWIFSGDFQLGMRAKEACKFLLDQYPNYTCKEYGVPLTFAEVFAEVAENIKTADSMGRELFGDFGFVSYNGFFYPDDEETAWKIYDDEEDKLLED